MRERSRVEWSRVARRFAAAVLLGAVTLGFLEPLIAEAHDGDAVQSITASTLEEDRSGSPDGAPPVHTAHLCHCTHVHSAAVLAVFAVRVSVTLLDEDPPSWHVLRPSSAARDGSWRPPAGIARV